MNTVQNTISYSESNFNIILAFAKPKSQMYGAESDKLNKFFNRENP